MVPATCKEHRESECCSTNKVWILLGRKRKMDVEWNRVYYIWYGSYIVILVFLLTQRPQLSAYKTVNV
jgi:hypothetical protein